MKLEKQLQVLNHVDMDTQNLMSVSFHLSPRQSQSDSHGLSYLGTRKRYQALGETMGFDKSLSLYFMRYLGYIPGARR